MDRLVLSRESAEMALRQVPRQEVVRDTSHAVDRAGWWLNGAVFSISGDGAHDESFFSLFVLNFFKVSHLKLSSAKHLTSSLSESQQRKATKLRQQSRRRPGNSSMISQGSPRSGQKVRARGQGKRLGVGSRESGVGSRESGEQGKDPTVH